MVRFIVVFVLISLVFFSCSKDNESNAYFPLKEFKLFNSNRQIRTIDYNNQKYFFKYNTKGQITNIYKISNRDTTNYAKLYYDQYDRLINANYYDIYNYKDSYEYYKDQIIINETNSYDNDFKNYQMKRVLNYNNLGECIRIEEWKYDSVLGKPKYTGNYWINTWKDDNLVSVARYYNYNYVGTSTSTYDTIINPIRGLSHCISPDDAYGTCLSKNMIKSIGNLANHYVTKFKYEFNQDSFMNRYYYDDQWDRWYSDLNIEFN